MPKLHQKQNRQNGQILILALLFLAILLTASTALVGYTTLQLQAQRQTNYQRQALDLAEAGVDEALYQLNQNANYTGETGTALGSGQFTTTVTTLDFNDKQITSTGYIPNNVNPVETKSVSVVANLNSSVVSLHYGIQ